MKDKDIVGAPKASDKIFSFKPMGPKVPVSKPAGAVSAAKSSGAAKSKAAKKSPAKKAK